MTYEQKIQQATTLQNSGDLQGAIEIYMRLLPKNRKKLDLLIRISIATYSLGNNKQAKKLAQKVLKLRSGVSIAHNIIGLIEWADGHINPALFHLEKAVQSTPQDAQTRLNLAAVLNSINRTSDAMQHLEEAVRIKPPSSMACYALGVAHKSTGNIDGATEMFRNALEIDPLSASTWLSLANMNKTDLENDVEAMKVAFDSLTDQPRERARILFALFSTYERAEQYAKAFDYLERGNQLFNSTFNYDASKSEAYLKSIAEAFPPSLFERFDTSASFVQGPIFIVGMPRSGTTLVEQILAGHSQVDACGELSALNNAINEIEAKPRAHYPETVSRWKKNDVKRISRFYSNIIRKLNIVAPLSIDKMPENFLYLGVVKLAFPNARIIHMQRDPIDNCLGLYRQIFTESHPQFYDQKNISRYYKAYTGLMAHWQSVMGDMILDVRYEDVVENPKKQAKRILEFCSLDWEAQCLDIKNTDRAVYTASATQVRSGIHKDFVARWRKYEPYIKTLIDDLS